MKTLPACLLLAAFPLSAHAANLFIDPADNVGYSTFDVTSPYPTTSTDIWNSGSSISANESQFGNNTGVLKYSDGTTATGVRVVSDALTRIGSLPEDHIYQYDFAEHSTPSVGNGGITGLFGDSPFDDSVYGNKTSTFDYGGVAAKVTGLASGTYDIYIVGAYTGSNDQAWPGVGQSTAHQSVWAFASASITTLETGTFGTAGDYLENDNNATWSQGDNYAKITVTLDAMNPDLILVNEGEADLSEDRGWLTAIQIVAVPEPSSMLLLLGGMLPLLAARRR